jgi:hypothetical protein
MKGELFYAVLTSRLPYANTAADYSVLVTSTRDKIRDPTNPNRPNRIFASLWRGKMTILESAGYYRIERNEMNSNHSGRLTCFALCGILVIGGIILGSCSKKNSPTGDDNNNYPGWGRMEYVGSTLWRGQNDVAVLGAYAVCAMTYGLRVLDVTNPSDIRSVSKLYIPAGECHRVTLNGSYAYLIGPTCGLQIVDLSDPSNPLKVGECQTPGEGKDIAVFGNYAYVADGTARVQVVDISNPQSPAVIGGVNIPDCASGIKVRGQFAFVAHGSAGLYILDLSNPSSPYVIGLFDTPGWTRDVELKDNYAYLADGPNVLVVDVANPSQPVLVDSLPAPEGKYIAELAIDSNFLYAFMGNLGDWPAVLVSIQTINISNPTIPVWGASVGSFVDGRSIIAGNRQLLISDHEDGLHIYSLTEPAVPIFAGRTGLRAPMQDIALKGNYAFVAAGTGGLRVIDITAPDNPVPAGVYRTPLAANAVTIAGDYAFVSDSFSLQIVGISNPLAPTYVGSFVTGPTCKRVFISGTHAFVASGEAGLHILDISTPSSPKLVSTYVSLSPVEAVVIVDTFAYIATWQFLDMVNVSDPTNPYVINRQSSVGSEMALHQHFLITNRGGIFDITNRTNPSPISFSDLAGGDIALDGDYGIGGYYQIMAHDLSALPSLGKGKGYYWNHEGVASTGLALDSGYVYSATTAGFVVLRLH